MRKGVLGAGIALILLSLIMTPAIYFVGNYYLADENPSEDYEKRLVAPGDTITLGKGEHDIWVESTIKDINITDPQNEGVEIKDPGLSVDIEGYEKYGTFDITEIRRLRG